MITFAYSATGLRVVNCVCVPRELRAAQPQTWRSRVIKVDAVVVRSTRRVVIRLAAQWPHWDLYVRQHRQTANALKNA